jgi:autotransporter-associated beta strand protein
MLAEVDLCVASSHRGIDAQLLRFSSAVWIFLAFVAAASAQNTTNNYSGSAVGSLVGPSNWSLGHVPIVSEDAVFPSGASTGIRTLTANTLTVGSFDVLATSGTFSIRNETSTSTNSTLTLGGAGDLGNGVSGNSADLLYANTGSTFNIIGPNGGSGTGVLNVALGQTGNFDVAGTMTISAAISDGGNNYSITKTGNGQLTLSGANTFGGGLTLSAGTLNINSATAPGTGTLTINSGTIANTSGSAITLGNNNSQIWGGDFAFDGTAGTNNLNLGTGTVILTANRQITTNGLTSTLIVGGAIGGSGFSLTKAGVGTLTLPGANTYSGGTTLSAGTLNINNASALGTALLRPFSCLLCTDALARDLSVIGYFARPCRRVINSSLSFIRHPMFGFRRCLVISYEKLDGLKPSSFTNGLGGYSVQVSFKTSLSDGYIGRCERCGAPEATPKNDAMRVSRSVCRVLLRFHPSSRIPLSANLTDPRPPPRSRAEAGT